MTYSICKVEQGSILAKMFRDYVASFSWEEAKEHLLWMIDTWSWADWESPFVMLDGEWIIGMVTAAKTDSYPMPDIYPWVSGIFVSEEYRGHRLSGQLIDFANAYLRSLGFVQSYIPSIHTGLYEKYGYVYVRDIVNYGGDTDRLYRKEL